EAGAIVACSITPSVKLTVTPAASAVRRADSSMPAGVTVNFTEGVIEHATIAPASADIVTLRHVLWTVKDPHLVLRKARGLLRPGGLLIVSDGLWSAAPGFGWAHSDETEQRLPYHGGIRESEARALLHEAGFDVLQAGQHLFGSCPIRNIRLSSS
ncbi:MAG: class I SAM-dependent methyltransferase, partial [Hyphomicrobiales bacterium]